MNTKTLPKPVAAAPPDTASATDPKFLESLNRVRKYAGPMLARLAK